jgi:hypothetical protein
MGSTAQAETLVNVRQSGRTIRAIEVLAERMIGVKRLFIFPLHFEFPVECS